MPTYYCNCGGFEFNEKEAQKHYHNENVIICPMCGAERWDDDDDNVIEKLSGEET